MTEIQPRTLKLTELKPYPGNARRGNIEALKESLEKHGQYRSIVVQESTGYVLAGNHTMLAAKELGWKNIDVDVIDVDDDQARRIVLVDNRTNDLAEYDNQALADLLSELPDLSGTGFDDQAMSDLLASIGPGGFSKKELDQVIKAPANPVTKPGDAIIMGSHILHCADSFEVGDLASGFDMVWTDPPYLIGYRGDKYGPEKSRTDGLAIENEEISADDAAKFRLNAAELVHAALREGGVFYVHLPGGLAEALWVMTFDGVGLKCSQVLQWVKDQFVLSRQDYHNRSEPILYGWKRGAGHYWNGGRAQDSVWEVPRPKRSKEHPTIKPVELAIRAIENSTRPGQVVFDPFAGAGTLLAACLQTGRRASMVELDPAYCDVIVERYERLTGEQAIRRTDYPYLKLFEKGQP